MSWGVNSTNPLAGSLSGTQNAARVTKASNEKAKKSAARTERRDEYDHVDEATETEHAEAVRSLKDNTQEEAQEDRREHGTDGAVAPEHAGQADESDRDQIPSRALYTPDAGVRPALKRSSRSIDLRG